MSEPYIWVIENDPSLCKLIRAELSRYDYRLRFFDDGSEPLEEARSGHLPDLILLDLLLPTSDGFEVLRQFRKSWKQADLPIIVLSALTGRPSIAKGLGLGANDYIVKPYHHDEFHSRIQAQLYIGRLHGKADPISPNGH